MAILLLLGVAATLEESAGSLGQVVVITTQLEITLAHPFGEALRLAKPLELEMKRSFLKGRSWIMLT